MKHILKSFALLFIFTVSVVAKAQTYEFFQTQNYHNQLRLNTKTGEVYQVQDDGGSWLVNNAITPKSVISKRYWLYPTKNIWTYILVDTFTGKLWQTQFTVHSEGSRFSIPINEKALSNSKHSTFVVKPMISMYQFYLINSNTGEMWKFQWNTENDESYRWIEKIR